VLANKVHMNTVLTGVSWDWIEPEEGKYDFRLVDQLIASARQNNVRIVWIWFASWKNGLSSFAPAWVKAAQDRFPRAQIRGGKTIEVLSTLSAENLRADARAFAALMKHTREVDLTHRVIMVQLENEVGVLGDSRDRSPAANEAFAKPARRPENPFESTAGIIPGDRGKDGGSWCRYPLSVAIRSQAPSPAPLAGVMTGQQHELRS
jgi:beta-galactosidase GanA